MSKVKIIGGVAFQEAELIKAYENAEENKNTVELKGGTTVIFPNQEFEREAEVFKNTEGRIDFRGLKDAVIIDTPQNDIYRLMGCENVLVSADHHYDSDLIQVTHRRLSTGEIQQSENNRICLNKDDLYTLPNSERFYSADCGTDIEA